MNTPFFLITCVVASSAFGGFVLGITRSNSYNVRLPVSGKLLEIGFFGDVFVGSAAGVAVFFVASSLFNIKISYSGNITDVNELLRTIALGVISGFAGIGLLSRMSEKLIENVIRTEEKLETFEIQVQSDKNVSMGDFACLNNKYDQAVLFYRRSLEISPDNEAAVVGIARSRNTTATMRRHSTL